MSFLNYTFFFNLIFCLVSGTSRFYKNFKEYKYDSSVKFDYPHQFDCVCINGLWKFHASSFQDIHFVGGENQYCFNTFDSEILQANQILKDKSDIVIEREDRTITPLNKNVPINSIELTAGDRIITGSDWMFTDDIETSFCLKTTQDSYCFFTPRKFGLRTISKIHKGCKGTRHVLVDPTECVNIQEETKNICEHHVVKRQAHSKGRSFFGGPGQKHEIFNQTVEQLPNSTLIYDEDYVPNNATSEGNGTKGGIHDAIASEIWNFLEGKLDTILGLNKISDDHPAETAWAPADDPDKGDTKLKRGKRGTLWGKKDGTILKKATAKEDKNLHTLEPYKSPLYKFLELSKEVMKRTCPVGYVNPDFFDLAISTFIKIQNKHLRFPDGEKSYSGYSRIVESFNSCIKNATEFNFTIDPCASKEKPVSGLYCAYGNCSIEINMYGGFENFEPIIETVWNIWKNAHSYCFNHFNKYYNDHHRLTMWMIPLFQNDINDIWNNGTATGVVYGGVFGNQENVQTAVAYCTASSLMLSNYPWDLPRPHKIEELSTKQNPDPPVGSTT